MKILNVRLSDEQHAMLKAYAQEKDVSMVSVLAKCTETLGQEVPEAPKPRVEVRKVKKVPKESFPQWCKRLGRPVSVITKAQYDLEHGV